MRDTSRTGWPGYVPLAALLLFAPPAVAGACLYHFHSGPRDCVPAVWNDEVHYWNEIACFARAGFKGGYCVLDERPAPANWTHFGPHGPAFPVIYGVPAHIFGWERASGPLFNAVVLVLGAAVWLVTCRPDVRRLAAASFLWASFWPCVLFMPFTMQESLHFAIAFLLGAVFYRWVRPDQGIPGAWLPVLAVAAAALVRLTWALTLLPWACVAVGRLPPRKMLFVVVASAIALPLLTLTWREICSPYANYLASLLEQAAVSPSAAAGRLWTGICRSCALFVSLRERPTLDTLLCYQSAGLMIIAVAFALAHRRGAWRPWLFAAMNVALVVGLVIALYDLKDWRGYRVIAPHLLLSTLLLVAGGAWRTVVLFAAINLAFTPWFLDQFQEFQVRRMMVAAETVRAGRTGFADTIAYAPDAPPWENTLLVPVEQLSYRLVEVPRGIGVTYVMVWPDLRMPPKSRYMLLTSNDLQVLAKKGGMPRLRPLRNQGPAVLYLNEGAAPTGEN